MTRRLNPARGRIGLAAAIAFLLGSPAAPRAQRIAPNPPRKALVPVAASSLADHPDAFYGDRVSLFGSVEHRLSAAVFSVDQGRATSTGNEVLVIAPALYGTVDLNTYVTVIGEAVRFDPTVIAKKMQDRAPALPPEIVARYRGRPAVIATAVINAAMTDLTRRLPPPMTAAEKAFSDVMQRVGPAFAVLRTGIDASSATLTRMNTSVLKQAFAETEAFWRTRGQAEPAGWALAAAQQVGAIEAGAAKGNWGDVRAAAGTLGQSCATCHTAYRDRFDDGSFRVKMSAQ